MYRLSVTSQIDAAHYLHVGDDRTDPRKRVHGHSYEVRLWVSGESVGARGVLTDLDALKAELDAVCGAMTHRLLNDVPGLDHSSMEAMCRYVFDRMRGHSDLVSSVELFRPSLGYRAVYERPG